MAFTEKSWGENKTTQYKLSFPLPGASEPSPIFDQKKSNSVISASGQID